MAAIKTGNRRRRAPIGAKAFFVFVFLLQPALNTGLPAGHGAALASETDAALDAPWPRLPDGRVLIRVKDTEFALPLGARDANDIKFQVWPFTKSISLRDVIERPADARRFFAQDEIIRLHMPSIYDRTWPFIDHFNRADYKNYTFAIEVGGSRAQMLCKSWSNQYRRLREKEKLLSDPTKPFEWKSFLVGKSPDTYAYIDVGRSFNAPQDFESIQCDQFGICRVNACVGTDKSLSYIFGRAEGDKGWTFPVRKALAVFKYVWPKEAAQWGDRK